MSHDPKHARPSGPARRSVLKAGGAAAAVGVPVATEVTAAVTVTETPRAVPGVAQAEITLRVNGADHPVSVEARVTLLDALRERLALTGTKKACDRGECGACTVLVDGRRVMSCSTLAVMQQDREITTVEGLADGDRLHPVQEAFVRRDALQCGFCTPGQVMSAVACIEEGHAGSREEIRQWMSGNLCRCGCYPNIVDAVTDAAGAVER